MQVTLLGTGTSTGVPMIGCSCRTCLSDDPHDKRLRVSALIEVNSKNILIDTSADFRQQMLTRNVKRLDAILYTHHHYDHIAGFDDLRAFQFLTRKSPQCYATEECFSFIRRTFAYAFGEAMQQGGGLPSVEFTMIGEEPIVIQGIEVQPIPLLHGKLPMVGYRIGGFAYLTDCSSIPERSYDALRDLDILVLDGLRYKQHPTHFSIAEAVEHARRIGARKTYLTHMNHDILHRETSKELPEGIELAYDGIQFTL